VIKVKVAAATEFPGVSEFQLRIGTFDVRGLMFDLKLTESEMRNLVEKESPSR